MSNDSGEAMRLCYGAGRVILNEPVAGRGERAATLDYFGPVTHLLQQLERGWEVIHIKPDRLVKVYHSLPGDLVNSIPRLAQYSTRVSLMNAPSLSESIPRTGNGSCLARASTPSTTKDCSLILQPQFKNR